jgi:carbamoylphosphate synthase small subunit
VGYLGYDGNLDTAITIRSAVLRDDRIHLTVGAGIVAGSVPEREFDETEHKAGAMKRAIELAMAEATEAAELAESAAEAAESAGDARGRTDPSRAGRHCPGPSRHDSIGAVPMLLMIDNYDSFTFNLVQALEAAGAEVKVLRNDAIDRAGIEALADDPSVGLRGIVVSPGPGDPDSAGVSMDAIRVAVERKIPLLGVCLGMQSMAQAFGATVGRAPTLVHGEASDVSHDSKGLLAGMPRRSRPPGITP